MTPSPAESESNSSRRLGKGAGKVLVTGASGFVGSHLVEALCAAGYPVRVLVRRTSRLEWIHDLPVELAYGDIRDKASLSGACVGVESIFHFGALTSARTEAEFFDANAHGTGNLAGALVERGVPGGLFVYCSSLAAGGPAIEVEQDPEPVRSESDPDTPITPYGRSKLEGERRLRELSERTGTFGVLVLRPPAVYGPRDSAILQFFQWIKRGILPLPGPDGARLSLIYVHDLVAGALRAAERNARGTYYVCDGGVYTWPDVGSAAAELMGISVRSIRVPEIASQVFAGLSDVLGWVTRKPPILSRWKVQEIRQRHWVCNADLAQGDWDFEPRYGLEDGLEELLTWYRDHHWL